MLQEVLEELGATNWECDGDDVLVCPHGHRIELDGGCPEGCVSPLVTAGMI